MEHERTEKHKK